MTSILNKLATSLNRRDEVPNQELAKEIVKANNKVAVKELVENLENKNKGIRFDCIKTLYEIALTNPDLVAVHFDLIVKGLKSKDNRMIWGTMEAIDNMVMEVPKKTFDHLNELIDAIDKGSVITIDHGVSVLSKLASISKYSETAFPLLLEQLRKCPSKQIPQYAEKSLKAINSKNKNELIKLLEKRFSELEKDTQRKRVEKVVNRLKS